MIIEISCLEVWKEISNYIENDIDPELRRRIEEHIKVCHHCTAILDGARNVIQLVADGKPFDLPTGFSQRLRQKIESRFEES